MKYISIVLSSILANLFTPSISLAEDFPHTLISKNLPQQIKENLSRIITDRNGAIPNSNMTTTEIRGYVNGNDIIEFQVGGLLKTNDLSPSAVVESVIETPSYTVIKGKWTSKDSFSKKEANILGKNGSFFLENNRKIEIPVVMATKNNLAYYNSILVKAGESVKIEADEPLPLSVVQTGINYERGYLSQANLGGGYYLETHTLPHLWSHIDQNGSGAIILGKQVAPHKYHLTAFQIPYESAIYAPGGVIHTDGLLIGNIMVIYSVTPEYSTVILRNQNRTLSKVLLHKDLSFP